MDTAGVSKDFEHTFDLLSCFLEEKMDMSHFFCYIRQHSLAVVFHRIEDSIFYGKRFAIVKRRQIETYPIPKVEKDHENISYSAMLNIAELVPPPNSVQIPFDSAIHGIPYRNRSPPSSTCIVLCSKVSPQYVDAIPVRNSGN